MAIRVITSDWDGNTSSLSSHNLLGPMKGIRNGFESFFLRHNEAQSQHVTRGSAVSRSLPGRGTLIDYRAVLSEPSKRSVRDHNELP